MVLGKKESHMFLVTANKGVHITFANGYSLSIQWGQGNYCQNRNIDVPYRSEVPASATAETAIIDPNGAFIEYNGNNVQGWQTPEQVAATMAYVAAL